MGDSPDTVRRWLEQFAAETQADEMIVAGQIHDHAACVRSFELVAQLRGEASNMVAAARVGA